MKSVNYIGMIGVLVEGMKQKQIEELKEKLNNL
jgi:hypothetical protein